jgi:hypothetical protein
VLRTFSSGGGVQSTAALVLTAQGRVDFPTHLFANVGADSEHPATLAYVRDVLRPFASAHGVNFVELHKTTRDGERETLLGRLTREGSRALPIPVRMSRTGAPGTRSCTVDFKLKVIAKWHKEHGADDDHPHVTGIGFSTDEMGRVGKARPRVGEIIEYPLLDLGLSRRACLALVAAAGLPTPPKSSCWFCPMHTVKAWASMRQEDPDQFERVAGLEDMLNERREMLDRDPVYFHRRLVPLREAVREVVTAEDPQLSLWAEESCDEGVCFV